MQVNAGQAWRGSGRIRLAATAAIVAIGTVTAQAQMQDATARRLATQTVAPIYPAESLQHKESGVVVAHVTTNEQGLVNSVTVLQAPGKAIEAATVAALRRWEFRPLWEPSGKATTLSARIVFYFLIEGATGAVRSPAETGYIGQWPDEPRARPRTNNSAGK